MKRLSLFVALLIFASPAFAGPQQGNITAPVQIDSAVARTFVTDQVAIGDTATLIKAAPLASKYRYSIVLFNAGSKTVWIGPANSVTKSNGFPILPNTGMALDRSYSSIYGICDTGLSSTIAYLEEGK